MKRILIVGGSSLIGANLARQLRSRYRVFATYAEHPIRIDQVIGFRLRFDPKVQLEEFLFKIKPQVVIYCAGNASDRFCTENPLVTTFVHSVVPGVIADVLKKWDGQLLYFSSSKIFSGDTGNYSEESNPQPQTVYGEAKLQAERLLADYPNVCILRLGTVFGLGSFGKISFLENILTHLWRSETMSLIHDEFRNFLDVRLLANAVESLLKIERLPNHIYHLASQERETYYSFGTKIARAFEKSEAILQPLSGIEFSERFQSFENRGKDLTLNGDSFLQSFSPRMLSLSDSLLTIRRSLAAGTQ